MDQEIIDKILIMCSALGFFLSILLFKKQNKSKHDYILASWLIFLSSYVSFYSFSNAEFFISNPWVINFYISLLLLNGPFLYVYIKSLTDTNFQLNAKVFLHLIPFIIFNFYLIYFFENKEILKNSCSIHGTTELKLPMFYMFFLYIIAFSVPVYIIKMILLIKKHKKIVSNNFSDTEKKTLVWMRDLMVILFIIWLILVSIIYIHHVLLYFTDSFCVNGLFLTFSALIILIGYYGLGQPVIFTKQSVFIIDDNKAREKTYSSNFLKQEDVELYKETLDSFMNNNKPFLNNKITLTQLAAEININPNYLSRIINENYNQNFCDYINHYRINEFIKRLSDNKYKNYSLIAIAFDCGFNSKTTFNRFFKKVTKLTPSEYKNQYYT